MSRFNLISLMSEPEWMCEEAKGNWIKKVNYDSLTQRFY